MAMKEIRGSAYRFLKAHPCRKYVQCREIKMLVRGSAPESQQSEPNPAKSDWASNARQDSRVRGGGTQTAEGDDQLCKRGLVAKELSKWPILFMSPERSHWIPNEDELWMADKFPKVWMANL